MTDFVLQANISTSPSQASISAISNKDKRLAMHIATGLSLLCLQKLAKTESSITALDWLQRGNAIALQSAVTASKDSHKITQWGNQWKTALVAQSISYASGKSAIELPVTLLSAYAVGKHSIEQMGHALSSRKPVGALALHLFNILGTSILSAHTIYKVSVETFGQAAIFGFFGINQANTPAVPSDSSAVVIEQSSTLKAELSELDKQLAAKILGITEQGKKDLAAVKEDAKRRSAEGNAHDEKVEKEAADRRRIFLEGCRKREAQNISMQEQAERLIGNLYNLPKREPKPPATPKSNCSVVDPGLYNKKTIEQRVLSTLDPNCEEHAAIILGVPGNDCEKITKVYHKFQKEHHPDKNPEDFEMAVRMNLAKQTLCQPIQKLDPSEPIHATSTSFADSRFTS